MIADFYFCGTAGRLTGLAGMRQACIHATLGESGPLANLLGYLPRYPPWGFTSRSANGHL